MKIAAVCVVKNAEFRIGEWIAYHLAVGFDTIILVDNASTDGTAEVISLYSKFYDVRIISWPMTGALYQIRGFEYAVWSVRNDFDWCACIDADEFIVPPDGLLVKDAFNLENSSASAIALPWAVFGSGNHVSAPEGLVISSYLYRAEEGFFANQHIKSFVRPKAVVKCVTPHFFLVNGDYHDMGGHLIENPSSATNGTLPFKLGRINHYFVQSREDWKNKLNRGYHDNTVRSEEDFSLYDKNDVFDESARFYENDVLEIIDHVRSKSVGHGIVI